MSSTYHTALESGVVQSQDEFDRLRTALQSVESEQIRNAVVVTAAQYAALTPDASTLYLVVG